MIGNKCIIIFFGVLIYTIWPSGHNVCRGQLFAPKLKFGLIQLGVRPKPKPMNQSLDIMGPKSIYTSPYKSPRVFMEFLKKFEVNRSFIRNGREVR